jgi:hypothetical protein
MRWFKAFLNELDKDREYKHIFDNSLTSMFAGFPGDVPNSLKHRIDLDSTMRSLRADGNTACESAVYAVIDLISTLIAPVPAKEKQAALEALERHDHEGTPLSRGFYEMLQVVEQLDVKPALRSRISYEIVGQLKGMSPAAIHAWWIAVEVPNLIDNVATAEPSTHEIAPMRRS